MPEQELNKKLAEWAGFHRHRTQFCDDRPPTEWAWELVTDTEIIDLTELPDFTQSLDACFKWLVPNFRGGIRLRTFGQLRNKEGFFCSIGGKYLPHHYVEAKTPALALCLAIDKLIDSEASNGRL